jgi:integrase/recombinase XerD
MQTKALFTKGKINSPALQNAFENFILSRQAMRCSPATIGFYRHTAETFVFWAEQSNGISEPSQVNSNLVRKFLADLDKKSASDWTMNDYARAIRTLLRFWHSEGIVADSIKFQMPRVRKKRMPVLSSDELRQFISACQTPRDKAIILLMVDSGIRRAEATALNWRDLNLEKGLCYIQSGKGGKSRVTIIGPSTRKALREYRNTLSSARSQDPLLQTWRGTRITDGGLLQVYIRLSKRAGLHVSPHTIRRTFVKLSLRSNMNPLHLKDLLGHESLDMVMYYAGQFDEEELLEAHKRHGPVENVLKHQTSL